MNNALRNFLFYDFTEPIRDPIWQNIYLSSGTKAVTQSPLFQKLSRIRQLGPTYHVYPGATHTRLNHSLGVFHIAKRLITKLLSGDNPPQLSLEGVKSFLIASLLHDIGHFPYAHSLKELPLKEHEAIAAEMILDSGLTSVIKDKAGADPLAVASIIDENMDPADNFEVPFYRSMLSGVLDPDKLDYLNRDAFFCGVPYGIQDTDFYIDKIRFDQRKIVLEESGITAIENILFSKYLMYKTVYWHKTVRIATAMIKKATALALREGYLKPRQLYGLDDDDFYKTVHTPNFVPLKLIDRVFNRDLYKVAVDIDYSEKRHSKLLDLSSRFETEEMIAGELSGLTGTKWECQDVIIDIPEPISFEVDLHVKMPGGLRLFRDLHTGFSTAAVENFILSLRKLRVFIPESKSDGKTAGCIQSILNENIHGESNSR